MGEGVDYRHEHDEGVEVFSSVRFVFDNLTERVDDFVDVDVDVEIYIMFHGFLTPPPAFWGRDFFSSWESYINIIFCP